MTEEKAQYGTPSMILLPSANYKFSVSEKVHSITIPRKGTYHDLDKNFFTEKDGEFNLFDDKSKVMWLPAVSKVLYATKKYPKLGANQLFAPLSLEFKKDKVEILGHVIEILNP